jgi:hypothetical protein
MGTMSIEENNTFTVTLKPSDAIQVRYSQSANSSMPRLVGITPGGGAPDPSPPGNWTSTSGR